MRCEQISEWFGSYRDLPEDSPERIMVDVHVRSCLACAEEFRMWEESAELIREFPLEGQEEDAPVNVEWVNRNVMDRIYAEQSWFMPAVRRTYQFTNGFRLKVAGVLAGLMALFVIGFVYAMFERMSSHEGEFSGAMETASNFTSSHDASSPGLYFNPPIASLSEPYILKVSPGVPEYWIALSIVGMIMTLLFLNWLSRVRA